MNIAIKSETDSRILIYPLIKCLHGFGTICIVTNNIMFSRLIEGEVEGGFKNVRILVTPDGDMEGMLEVDEYYEGKYDYLILDNVGAVDYDILIAIVTNKITDTYVQDLLYVIGDEKTHILKFGSPAPGGKTEKSGKDSSKDKAKAKPKKGKKGEEPEPVEEEEVLDDDFNKWDDKKTDEDILTEKLSTSQSKWCKFPTFDAIETMEARHYMMVPDETLLKEIHRLFSTNLSVDYHHFQKGVKIKDESSSDISGLDVR